MSDEEIRNLVARFCTSATVLSCIVVALFVFGWPARILWLTVAFWFLPLGMLIAGRINQRLCDGREARNDDA